MKFTGKNYFLFLVLIFWSLNILYGQTAYDPTLKPGAKWEIEIGAGMNNYNYGYLLVTCDTVEINEKQYVLLRGTSSTGLNECGAVSYVREDTSERKIYFLPEADENLEELLLIDYTLEQGDTFFLHNGWGQQVVDTVRYIEFWGQTAKFIDFGCAPCEGFIEGFGMYSSGPSINCEGYSYISGYEIVDCDEVNEVAEVVPSDAVLVYPNPAGDNLNIAIKTPSITYPVLLEIRSLTGELLVEKPVFSSHISLEMDGLPMGILWMKIIGRDILLSRKIIHLSEK
ncbi:MAG: T9SS type A sorting domain-containing protein [Saprospiraceae bacterium]|nr:T9SS type A sorting domain-containing protein [Saprospiraceae bacterium]MCB9323940.1 T9SS type A sorting domain-containing protein [Lewinellaceae bacterium]